jgi:uncharacterized protein with PIN domain
VTTNFYLNNMEARRLFQFTKNKVIITNDECLLYIRVKLDRILIYRQHTVAMKNKLKSRNSIIARLAGTSCECNTNVLKTSTLALLYSVGEYCAPVWTRSALCNKINIKLNQFMRIITGTVKSTQTQWFQFSPKYYHLIYVKAASFILEQIKTKRTFQITAMFLFT